METPRCPACNAETVLRTRVGREATLPYAVVPTWWVECLNRGCSVSGPVSHDAEQAVDFFLRLSYCKE